MNKILIVDDDPIVPILLKRQIDSFAESYKIDVAENGKNAIDIIDGCQEDIQCVPDFIFLDINMPLMNGFDFLEEWETRNINTLKNVAIIILSSSVDPRDKQRAAKFSSVSEFRSKPLMNQDVRDLFDKYLIN
jgi:CheY-like chemotaxis protein